MKKLFSAILVMVAVMSLSSCSYNSMVQMDENCKAQWGAVESQYQRRADLIPNLVATVKGVANFEKSTLVDVTDARARATSITVDPTKLTPETIQKYQAAQGQLSTALGRLLVASENYPQLRANDNFTALQAQLEGTENRITTARYGFNHAITGADELQIYLMVAMAFLGAVVAHIRRRHLRMDVLTRHFPPAVARWLNGIEALLAIAVCGLMTWISWIAS